MHPLEGPRLKVKRAEREIQSLRDAEAAFRKNSDYRVVREEVNPKSGQDVYRVRTSSPPPDPEWGVWIGEVAHNLRSALDSLVYQLALLKTKTPTGNTQFPIFLVGRTKRFRRGRRGRKILIPHFEGKELADGRPMIQNLNVPHQTLIERLQPYKRRRGGHASPCYWLKEVNNADKHRLIQVVAAKWGGGPFISGWGGEIAEFPFVFTGSRMLKDGAKFGEAPRGMHVNPKLIPLIAFWEGCPQVKGKGGTNTLRIIAEDVSKIIEMFAPEFS